MIDIEIINDDIFLTSLQAEIISLLEEEGSLNRRSLVRKLSVPRTTIYDNLKRLQKRKIVEKFSKKIGCRGRPPIFWRLR